MTIQREGTVALAGQKYLCWRCRLHFTLPYKISCL